MGQTGVSGLDWLVRKDVFCVSDTQNTMRKCPKVIVRHKVETWEEAEEEEPLLFFFYFIHCTTLVNFSGKTGDCLITDLALSWSTGMLWYLSGACGESSAFDSVWQPR